MLTSVPMGQCNDEIGIATDLGAAHRTINHTIDMTQCSSEILDWPVEVLTLALDKTITGEFKIRFCPTYVFK
jgi:hypothetical protein